MANFPKRKDKGEALKQALRKILYTTGGALGGSSIGGVAGNLGAKAVAYPEMGNYLSNKALTAGNALQNLLVLALQYGGPVLGALQGGRAGYTYADKTGSERDSMFVPEAFLQGYREGI